MKTNRCHPLKILISVNKLLISFNGISHSLANHKANNRICSAQNYFGVRLADQN